MNNANNRNQHNASDTNQLGVDNVRLGLESMIKNCSVERIVAYLYFVVQKYNVTIVQLAQFKEPAEVFEALRCLVRLFGDESYESYLKKVASNSIAKTIKLESLAERMDLTVLREITDTDIELLCKYHNEYTFLMGQNSPEFFNVEPYPLCSLTLQCR